MVVLTGIEAAPIISNDSIQWIDVRVPLTDNQPSPELHTPPIDDASSVCIIRDESPIYFLWRIHKNNPNVLEIVQFDSFERFPSVGLHVTFTKALGPFASICKNEFSSDSRNPYMLYTMSVDGVVCLIHLNNVTNYGSGSVLTTPEVEELNTHNFAVHGTITSIAATAGFVVIGKHNGWVGCFRLGSLESGSQGFQYELQEDARNMIDHFVTKVLRKTVAPVMDLLCLEIRGRKVTFVLYEDGLLQLWDLLRCSRYFDNMLEGKFSAIAAPTWKNDRQFVNSYVRSTLFFNLIPKQWNSVLIIIHKGFGFAHDKNQINYGTNPIFLLQCSPACNSIQAQHFLKFNSR
ncbi:nucleoporin [Artemisia annua]|uniref:Nucleoporin n=1 Tax=Artemisia annua TaxID=35608 RepID=A0A2U1LKT2_ARTAN|nr:nucleoporin [Artemisia annua]